MTETTPQALRLRESEVLSKLRAACEEAGSQVKWARGHGLSGVYVSNVLHGRCGPGDGILRALGLQKDLGYVEREGSR